MIFSLFFFHPQINHVQELHPADHIAFPRFLSPEADWFKLYWHHAIIEDIDYQSELIRVIHFQPIFDEGFREQRERENNQLELFNSERRSVTTETTVPFTLCERVTFFNFCLQLHSKFQNNRPKNPP